MLIDALTKQMTFENVMVNVLSAIAVIFITMPIHEWAHGFASTKLGDPTPRYQGRLTLNPMAHIDWLGAAAILLFGIGWAKPVQVNARYYKNPKWGMVLVAFAGPLVNILLGLVMLFVSNLILFIFSSVIYVESITVINIAGMTMDFFWMIAYISIYLAVFNLIPIPPFDGSRILFAFLPQKYYFQIMQYERYIFIGLLALLYSGVLDAPLNLVFGNVFGIINQIAELPFSF